MPHFTEPTTHYWQQLLPPEAGPWLLLRRPAAMAGLLGVDAIDDVKQVVQDGSAGNGSGQ